MARKVAGIGPRSRASKVDQTQSELKPHPHEFDISQSLPMAQVTVPQKWIDYNGHMTESSFLTLASKASVEFLKYIGAGRNYVATGRSYYSVENHVRYYAEAKLGDRLTATIQVLHADPKRLHMFVRLMRGDCEIASVNQLNLHVDMNTARASPASNEVLARLMPIAEAHKRLPRPEVADRYVGQQT